MRDVETEYHFLLICPTFSHLRIKYLGNLASPWPSVQKFINVMSSVNQKTIVNLGKFVNEAFKLRSQLLEPSD